MYPALLDVLAAVDEQVVADYIKKDRSDFDKVEFSEKVSDVTQGDDVPVSGRITSSVAWKPISIVDLNDRADVDRRH